MKKADYNDAFLDHQPFSRWRMIRRYLKNVYGIGEPMVEHLMELHKFGEYTLKDFESSELLYNWCPKRNRKLVDDGWVYPYRKKEGRTRKFSLFSLTPKGKRLVKDAHLYSLGEKQMDYSKLERVKDKGMMVNRLINKIKLEQEGKY